ncbi:MAG: nicotinate-nucleotide--dimethylbenzimidazole phosphoribosyltransferase, partial [Candidatus Competibacteraceae bacterium]|nr:nicotinate-nucleotide--dimethylbenzimidazole phosphoribosyltransferase [Candidatus Competibacteraceae bacterium]
MSHPWFDDPIPGPDAATLAAAHERQAQLTKPPGSLGRLERLGATLAAMQGTQQPRLD